LALTALALGGVAGCGGRQPVTPKPDATATAGANRKGHSGEDIRQQTGAFYNERYMSVEDRFRVRRTRILNALGAQ
jgi:hypothetical protein